MKNNPMLVIPAFALLLSGCVFNPQSVSFSHDLAVPTTALGGGKTIQLSVKDERDDQALGRRGNGAISAAAITTKDDIIQVVRDKFAKGLGQLDFVVSPPNGGDRQLTVELRLLQYGTSQGFWTGGVSTKGTIKILADFGGKKFEKIYHAEEEERVMVVPTAEHNAELLNKILDETVLKAFADDEFRQFLRS